MSRLRAVVAALTLGAPFVATAADITRVASSFEDDDPFGMFIDVGFEHTHRRTKILRELLPQGTANAPVRQRALVQGERSAAELRPGVRHRAGRRALVRPAHRLPANEEWSFVSGTNASNSTITNNCLRADGSLTDPNCPTTGAGTQALFNVPLETFRGGLGNMRFGLAWSFFNQRKDDTKPTWVLGLDYEAPTAALLDPSVLTSKDDRGAVGDRVHKYTMYTALSRKIGIAEPYFKVHYTVPVRGPGAYTNCDNRNVDPQNLGTPQNCGIDGWDRKETGIQAPHTGGVMFGSEIQVYNQPTRKFTAGPAGHRQLRVRRAATTTS